jgi:signal peptidase II
MRYRPLLITAAFAAAADALTKATAVALPRWMPARLPGGWALQVAHNNGAVLGIGAGTAAPDVFAALTVVEIAFLLFTSRYQRGRMRAVALGLICGGAAANLGDRQLFGYVVDWIRPPHVPIVFDLADVAVAVGQVPLIALQVLGMLTSRVRTRAAVTR